MSPAPGPDSLTARDLGSWRLHDGAGKASFSVHDKCCDSKLLYGEFQGATLWQMSRQHRKWTVNCKYLKGKVAENILCSVDITIIRI